MAAETQAIVLLVVEIAAIMIFSGIAALIFLRRSNNWVSLLVALMLITFGTAVSISPRPLLELYSWLRPAVFALQIVGAVTFLWVLYLFPDGKFVPKWTRFAAVLGGVYLGTWFLFPSQAALNLTNPEAHPFLLRMLVTLDVLDTDLQSFHFGFSTFASGLLFLWIFTGVYAQIFRYKKVSNVVERQQTKIVIIGLITTLFGLIGLNLGAIFVPVGTLVGRSSLAFLVYIASILLTFIMPAAIGISILKFRLWDIDPLINRALVYGVLTSLLALVYLMSVIGFQGVFRRAGYLNSDLALFASTLITAGLFYPLRQAIQNFIDFRFYRKKVNFRKSFTQFTREVRTIIDYDDLLKLVVTRIPELLDVTLGAIFVRAQNGNLELRNAHNLVAADPLTPKAYELHRLASGNLVTNPADLRFKILVPLFTPQTRSNRLVAVLGLGDRLSGAGFSSEDQKLLREFASQAGIALDVAQLILEKQAEEERRKEVESKLEFYRKSPVGRAK